MIFTEILIRTTLTIINVSWAANQHRIISEESYYTEDLSNDVGLYDFRDAENADGISECVALVCSLIEDRNIWTIASLHQHFTISFK